MAGKTMVEKIMAAHCDEHKEVTAGDYLYLKLDLLLGSDATTPIAIDEFRKLNLNKVFDPSKVVLVMDHFSPAKDITSANQIKRIRIFVKEMGIEHFYDVGKMGIEHCLLPEQGFVKPGNVIIGADSHTCTYGALGAFATGVGSTDLAAAMAEGKTWFRVPESIKINYSGNINKWVSGKDFILYTIGKLGVDGAIYKAVEFTGEAIKQLSMANRFTIANMAVEMGAKVGLMEVDEKVESYLKNRIDNNYSTFYSDSNANYFKKYEIDVSKIDPQVALPHSPENTISVNNIDDIYLDQVVIGSCTNGRLEDLRIAAKILKNKKVAPSIRLLIFPCSQEIYLNALKEGLIETFINSGGAVSTPTCGPCLGAHMGVLGEGEKALSTTNRNFVGRMGDPKSEVFLSSPAVAAASAITGKISHPEEVVQ